MAQKIGTLITSTGQAGPSGPTGASGPSGPSGAPGATGPSGASGAPGDTTGGSSFLAIYLNAPMTISHLSTPPTPIFMPIPLAPDTAWEYEATIFYSCDDPTATIYFAPSPTAAGLTYLSMTGELYYSENDPTFPAKRLPLTAGIIGTGSDDGGASITLETANTLYQASMRWRVINTGTDLAFATATCRLETTGATVTIGTNSVLTALGCQDYVVSDTSGTTVT